MIDNPWLQEYLQGIYDYNDGILFDTSKSDAWQAGWNIIREEEEDLNKPLLEKDNQG